MFAVVLGLLAFLYLAGVAVIICVEVNVVRVRGMHPRALLTPFTDRVDLTSGDRHVYRSQAEAQQTKGFEDVDVTFNPPPHRSGADTDTDTDADADAGDEPDGPSPERLPAGEQPRAQG